MLLQTLREPPPKGSLRESVLILYVLQKDLVEHAKFRALAQLLVDKDKGMEAFDEYRKVHFPWLETQKKKDKDVHVERLMREIKSGGLMIRPLGDTRVKSRLKSKLSPPSMGTTAADRLYKKLGMSIPIR